VDQRTIERIMIRAARRGARVVRLKAGDPFVFGRGGEEALALRAAGVPFEVLPGVSAAVAAPALAGIPVTHRGVAASFFVASGHDPELLAPTLARLQPGATTVVILMGLRHRQTLAKMLTASGWPSRLPVAIVWAASTPGERRWYGTLAELGEVALEQVDEAAGTIVLGDVVNVAVELGARACVPCAPGNMLNQA
jgi:uroporphyrin-III C-methyltransferase/precorrin-2 dehydrogenase/sirohydrochlorin ferrochelatase